MVTAAASAVSMPVSKAQICAFLFEVMTVPKRPVT